MATCESEAFDSVQFVMEYENGDLDDQTIIEGFQKLINNGLVWRLQGSYGRMAERLIETGYCHECEGK